MGSVYPFLYMGGRLIHLIFGSHCSLGLRKFWIIICFLLFTNNYMAEDTKKKIDVSTDQVLLALLRKQQLKKHYIKNKSTEVQSARGRQSRKLPGSKCSWKASGGAMG